MQSNIPMKSAGYVTGVLLCKHCEFGENIYYNSRDIEFFLGDFTFLEPCRTDLDEIFWRDGALLSVLYCCCLSVCV